MDKSRCQALLTIIRAERAKQADEVAPDAATAADNTATQQARLQALKNISGFALASLGLGAAGRGLVGLVNQFRRPPDTSRSSPAVLPLPYPVDPDSMPLALSRKERRRKLAGAADYLTSPQGTSLESMPAYMPAAVLTSLGAGLAGWKGVDMLLEARRKRERDEEHARAKNEFNKALLAQYDKPYDNKTAGDNELGHKLDQLYDLYTEKLAACKQAGLGGIVGAGLGGYLTYAGVSALLTGALAYNLAKKRSRQAVLEKALKQRQQQQFAEQPTPLYAVPVPTPHLAAPRAKEEAAAISNPMEAHLQEG